MTLDFKETDEIINELAEEHKLAERDVRRETKELEGSSVKVQEAEDAVAIAQAVATIIQEKAHAQISRIVTKCLKMVFEDEGYEFSIIFEQKRNKTEARLAFLRNGKELDPLRSSGGGAVDVAAFALRISSLIITRPPLRKTVLLDEPFKFVSEDYRYKVNKILEFLSEEFGVQFIMVTHLKEMEIGNTITL